ncbi:MAG: hypothetical protein LBB65_07185 [Burkholderiales bacterium]|jgi:hypothetical protein|nr:hypothetical protein [Burkholderiales bacterium]
MMNVPNKGGSYTLENGKLTQTQAPTKPALTRKPQFSSRPLAGEGAPKGRERAAAVEKTEPKETK